MDELLSITFWVGMGAFGLIVALICMMPYEMVVFLIEAYDVSHEILPYFTAHDMNNHAKQARTVITFMTLSAAVRIVGLLCVVIFCLKKSYGVLWYSSIAILVSFSTIISGMNVRWLWNWYIYFQENGLEENEGKCLNRVIFLMVGLSMVALLLLCMLYFVIIEYTPRCVARLGTWRAARNGYHSINNNDNTEDESDQDGDSDAIPLSLLSPAKGAG